MPKGSWQNNDFPDADDPVTVGWMIVSWRTVPNPKPCAHCARGDYSLVARQFEHLLDSVNQADAIAEFRRYVRMHANSKKNKHRKNESLFLTKVIRHRRISDNAGDKISEPG
jgi:hypothetical protein